MWGMAVAMPYSILGFLAVFVLLLNKLKEIMEKGYNLWFDGCGFH